MGIVKNNEILAKVINNHLMVEQNNYWGVSKLKCFETKATFLRNKTKKNVRWISMKQKFVSQHSNIHHIFNAYFHRESISFKGNRAFCDTAVRTQYVLPVTSPVSLLTQTSFYHTFCTVHTVHTVCSPSLL